MPPEHENKMLTWPDWPLKLRIWVMSDLTTKDAERLHMLISSHARYTDSKRAAEILAKNLARKNRGVPGAKASRKRSCPLCA
jgi:glutamate synthase domain-containing protein 3